MKDLVVEHLHVMREDLVVLSDISFGVAQHEFLAIVGPNGGGKSTLLRAVLDLLPSQGTITWHTDNIRYLPPLDHITRKGLPPLTVGDFMGFKAHHHTSDRLLDKVGLDASYHKRSFTTLSTGEFQRMLLAWTLLDKPEVVVLDEPTAGLDVEGERTIFSFLKELKQCTVLIATHHIHSALEYADHILFLNKRQLMFKPRSEVSLDELKQLYTKLEAHHE